MALKAVARFTGSIFILFRDPGARAPGFTLSLVSRAVVLPDIREQQVEEEAVAAARDEEVDRLRGRVVTG